MTLSPDEAREALDQVEAGRKAARLALRRNSGHLHMWIWGTFWVVVPIAFHFSEAFAARFTWVFALVGACASAYVGRFVEGSRIRKPFNPRFGALGLLLAAYAVAWILLLGSSDSKTIYAYFCTVSMFGYVVAGLWFDIYLVWVGLAATVLTFAGYYLFNPWFWIWMAIAGGGTLIGTGFYVRFFWKD